MKATRLGLLAVVVSLVALASANSGPPTGIPYRINTPSLTSTGAFGGSDPTRAVELAGHSWLWSAGARRFYVSDGQTSAAGCGFLNPNHVFGNPSLNPFDPTLLAHFFYCPSGGWIIEVFLPSPGASGQGLTWTLSATPSNSQFDFQTLMQHEFGHDTTPFHLNNQACVMNATLGVGQRRRTFCAGDIETVAGNGHGHARALASDALSTSSWPLPGTTGWNWWPQGSGFDYGMGFGAYQRGVGSGMPVDRLFKARSDSSGHGLQSCTVPGACVDVTGVPTGTVLRSPSAAFDYARNVWWLFWFDNDDRIFAAKSSNGVNFTNYGAITAFKWVLVNGAWVNQQSTPRSRLSVGAAYNQVNDQIVVAYSNWASVVGTTSNEGGGTYNVNFVTFGAGWPFSSVWKGPFGTGVSSDMPPAIACENSYVYNNCQLLISEPSSPNRSILSWQADFLVNGELRATTAAVDTGGWSFYPPSLTSQGPTSSGWMVGTVSGAGPCGSVWIIQKKWVNNSWSGWMNVPSSGCTIFGPRIGVSEVGLSYGLMYGI